MQDQILQQVTEIIADTLGLDDLTLTPATTAADVEGWDSLANVQILVAIEKRFRIQFRTGEIAAMIWLTARTTRGRVVVESATVLTPWCGSGPRTSQSA